MITKIKDKRLEQIVDLLVKYTSLDFSEKADISERGDEIDAFAAGLNTMAEELEASLQNEKKQALKIQALNAELEQKVLARTLELIESKKKYRDLFKFNPLPMWIMEANTFRFLRVNQAAVMQYGYTAEEFLSMTALDIRPEEEKERFIGLSRSGSTVPYNTGVWKHIRKNGTVILVQVNVSSVIFEGREARLALINDVTEREEMKELLETALHRSKDAQEIAHVGHWEADLLTGISTWSEEAFRIYGIEPGTEEGSYELFLRHLHPEDFERVKGITGRSMQTAESFSYHHRIITAAGKVKHILAVGEYLCNGAGKPVRLFGVALDVTELKEKEQQLIQSENQIRNFARHLNHIQEEERAHIAREIHDELGQQLAGIKIGLSEIVKKKNNSSDHAGEMIKDVDAAIRSMRKIATELRPGILDSLGLIPSIEWLATEFERKTKIKCQVEMNLRKVKFEKDLSNCFFRICQEALTNISKHAGANKVTISMWQKKKELILTITDNGKGMTSRKLANPFSMGLLGMRERASGIGGSLQIASKKNKGTAIELKVTV